ncbi:TD and POZ domain-containing protein 3-like [Argiope bruennichi]|uniref:TD and POZ domain-containing protein 3-like n=1 Tax=Argiope bruennichi TaxID=94029 RepID=UPI0024949D85|nr:TD and POZ domain-containing protein 3-like [Argiope bruennichi]
MAGTKLEVVYSDGDLCTNIQLKNVVFVYQWNIHNFVACLDRKYELSSLTFSTCESKWKLLLYPKPVYPKGKMLAACLINMSENEKSYGVKYKLWIVSSQGNKSMVSKEKMFRNRLDFDENILVSHKDLMDKNLLQSGSLVLCCEMDVLLDYVDLNEDLQYCQSAPVKNNACHLPNNISFKPSESEISNNLDQRVNINKKCSDSKLEKFSSDSKNFAALSNDLDYLSALSNDLDYLYVSKVFADVVLLCEGDEFVAHKYILAARSDYFRRILCSGIGMNNNAIEISDIKRSVLEAVLYFIYTGKLRDMTFDFALDILSTTKKFFISFFHERLIDYIRKTLTVDNVTDALKICENIHQSELKQVCMRFVNTHYSDVVNSSKWQALLQSNPGIAGEVLLTVASLKNHNIA